MKKEPLAKTNTLKEMLPILAPWLAMKKFRLTSRDFKECQETLSQNMAFVSWIGSILGFLAGVISLFIIFNEIWAAPNVFTWVAIYTNLIGGALCIVLLGMTVIKKGRAPVLRTIGDVAFHIAFAITTLCFFLADINNGVLTSSDTISAAFALITILILCQPGFWQEALAFDLLYVSSVVGCTLYGYIAHDIKAVEMYMLIAFIYIFASYCVYSAYNYVEIQRHFIQFKNDELLINSTHDSLTGMANRNGLRLYLQDHLAKWKERNYRVLVGMFDIDDFKLYNDAFGHLRGDEVLKSMAAAISSIDNPHLHIYRYGGEEFLLILTGADEESAKDMLEKCRLAVQSLKIVAPVGAPHQYLTISIGGAYWEVKEDYSFHDHVAAADTALYEAKKGSKNKSVYCTNIG